MVIQQLERETRTRAGWTVRKLVEAVEAHHDIAVTVCERAGLELWLLRAVAKNLLAGDPETVDSLRDAFGVSPNGE